MRYLTSLKDAHLDNVMECYHVNLDGRILSLAISLKQNLTPSDYANTLRRAAQWFDDVANGAVKEMPCNSDCQMLHKHTIVTV